jgi:hypothetical protein
MLPVWCGRTNADIVTICLSSPVPGGLDCSPLSVSCTPNGSDAKVEVITERALWHGRPQVLGANSRWYLIASMSTLCPLATRSRFPPNPLGRFLLLHGGPPSDSGSVSATGHSPDPIEGHQLACECAKETVRHRAPQPRARPARRPPRQVAPQAEKRSHRPARAGRPDRGVSVTLTLNPRSRTHRSEDSLAPGVEYSN